MPEAEAAYARALAFDETLIAQSADRVVETPNGRAFLTPSLPRVWDLNGLRVRESSTVDADVLLQEAEEILRENGSAHRRVVVPRTEHGAAVAGRFRELGWDEDRWLCMVLERGRDRIREASVVEVDTASLTPFRRLQEQVEPGPDDPGYHDEILEAWSRLAAAGRARHFVALVDGEPASCADLYSDGSTAQVEDVFTLPQHRGRGLAGSVITRAVGEASAAGHDFIFLIAEEDDWPKELYSRLGFEPVGVTYVFTRKPG